MLLHYGWKTTFDQQPQPWKQKIRPGDYSVPGAPKRPAKRSRTGRGKTFAGDAKTEAYTDDFKRELDSCYEEYRSGGELINEAGASVRIKAIISGKAGKWAMRFSISQKRLRNMKRA